MSTRHLHVNESLYTHPGRGREIKSLPEQVEGLAGLPDAALLECVKGLTYDEAQLRTDVGYLPEMDCAQEVIGGKFINNRINNSLAFLISRFVTY